MLIPHKTTSNRKHQHNNWNLSIYQQFHMRFKKMFFFVEFEKKFTLVCTARQIQYFEEIDHKRQWMQVVADFWQTIRIASKFVTKQL